MKKRNYTRILAIAVSVILLSSTLAVHALANSAVVRLHLEGVDQAGAIIVDGDDVIVVERELLTFNLQEFPNTYYADPDEFLAYTGKVTAEYTIHNHSNMSATARLLFPFGCEAEYARFYDYENDAFIHHVDHDKYDVLVDGEIIEKKIRHTFSSYNQQFVLDEDLGLISDTFVQDDFYSPDLTVTKYTFKISGVDIEKHPAADIGFDVSQGMDSYRIYFPDQNGAHTQKDNALRIHTGVQKNGREFDLYVFGTPFTTMPEWKVYENGGAEDEGVISGTAELIGTETLTFMDFTLANWNEGSGVSDVDWYNATIAEIKESDSHYDNYPIVDAYYYANGFQGSLMRWYEYEITVEAGARIVNTVTAPIYPSINLRYEPSVFGYTYLLSPAKTWKHFGELEIVINTPYYISSSSIDGFTKTEGGYTVKLKGLPDSELTFNLSASETPKLSMPAYVHGGWIVFSVVAALLIIGGGVIALVLISKKKPMIT